MNPLKISIYFNYYYYKFTEFLRLIVLLKNSFQILEEDLSVSGESPTPKKKSGNCVDYDDVYTRKGDRIN